MQPQFPVYFFSEEKKIARKAADDNEEEAKERRRLTHKKPRILLSSCVQFYLDGVEVVMVVLR